MRRVSYLGQAWEMRQWICERINSVPMDTACDLCNARRIHLSVRMRKTSVKAFESRANARMGEVSSGKRRLMSGRSAAARSIVYGLALSAIWTAPVLAVVDGDELKQSHSGAGTGAEQVSRASDVGGVEILRIGGVGEAGDVDHTVGIFDQVRQRSAVGQRALDPGHAFARGLRPAGQCPDRDALPPCRIQHGLSDEAGRTGDSEAHSRTR